MLGFKHIIHWSLFFVYYAQIENAHKKMWMKTHLLLQVGRHDNSPSNPQHGLNQKLQVQVNSLSKFGLQ